MVPPIKYIIPNDVKKEKLGQGYLLNCLTNGQIVIIVSFSR